MATSLSPGDVLTPAERSRIRALAADLSQLPLDGTGPLERVLPELRGLLGARHLMAHALEPCGEGYRSSFQLLSGESAPGKRMLGELDLWLQNSPERWGLYDPAHPEPSQRNVVQNLGRYYTFLEQEADAPRVRALGLERDAILRARGRLDVIERLPGIKWLLNEQHLLRALVCEGDELLAWVGAIDPGSFGCREEALLGAIVPCLQRRLALEHRLGQAALHTQGLGAAPEALPAPAFLVDQRGGILQANAAGKGWYDRDPAELCELLRAAARDEAVGFRISPVQAPGVPRHLLAMWEGAPRTAGIPEQRLARFCAQHGLTPREGDTLAQVVRGAANKEIAAALGRSEKTVEVHVTRLLRKTRTASRSELTAAFWSS